MATELSEANVFARAPEPAEPRRERAVRHNPVAQFLRETRIEIRKVIWPTREETTRLTIAVIVISAVTGLILGGFDYAIVQAFSLVH